MALAQRIGRSRHRLILLVLTAVSLLTLDLNGFGPLESAQGFVRDILHPVTEVAGVAASPFSDAWNGVFNYGDLERENQALEARVKELEADEIRNQADRQTLERLLIASELPYVENLDTVVATVVRGAVGNFDSDVITIDLGHRDGLESGMAVVTGAGLVGRVDRVDATTSTVQLISDSNLVIGVRLVATDEVGLGRADGDRFVINQGLDWPEDGDLSKLPPVGTGVVTSSFSRYPADIPIGWVTSAVSPDEGLSMVVRVELANDVADLGFVSVILAAGVDQVPLPETVVPSTSIPAGVSPDDMSLDGIDSDDGGATEGGDGG